jgi:ATP-dependent DNA helicase PIF1
VKGNRADTVGACIQQTLWWRQLQILHLTKNMCVGPEPDEREFVQWQLEVGEGRHTDNEGNITIPPQFHCAQNTVDCLIETIYPMLQTLNPGDPMNDKYFSARTILSARNNEVDDLNLKLLNDFPGEIKEFYSADTVVDGTDDGDLNMYPTEYLNSINMSGLPLATLKLKIGVPVMVMRNLAPLDGVCNGTRGIVTKMMNRVVEIRLISGSCAGNLFLVPRIKMETTKMDIPFIICRLQLPLRLAFAMSINKSQGQSVENVGLDLRSSVFGHGQFYVAISRVTSCKR